VNTGPELKQRPKSASATTRRTKVPDRSQDTGLSLDDWNLILKQCQEDKFHFSYLKKGGGIKQLDEPPPITPNRSTSYLKNVREKKAKEEIEFGKKLKEEMQSKSHYIQKCVEEINELCRELEIPQSYEFYSEKAVIKIHHSNLPFRRTSKPKDGGVPSSEEKLTSKDGKKKMLSLSKFNREHEEILDQYKALQKQTMTEIENNKIQQALAKSFEADEEQLHQHQLEVERAGGEQEPANNTNAKRPNSASGLKKGGGGGGKSKPKSPQKMKMDVTMDTEDDFFDDEQANGDDQNPHQKLNEIQKRELIQKMQQQILVELQEKDDLLLQQIEEIKKRGWNRSLWN
jgi:uncharacterized protein YdaU (DUF1376 family)